MSKFILSAFADEICDDLDGQMDALDRHGIKFIELRGVDGKNVSELSIEEAGDVRRRMAARGFAVSAVGSPVGKTFIEDEFEPAFGQFMHVAQLTRALGTRYIRVFSFFIPEGENPARWRGEVMKRMRAMADLAEKEGLVLLHENEKAIYGDLPERCRDIFDTVKSPALWATYDPSNFVQCGARNYPDAFRLLRDRIRYMHMKDSVYMVGSGEAAADTGFDRRVVSDAHRPVGLGDGNCREILRDLWIEGYEGFLSIEPHLVNNRDIPGSQAEKFDMAANALKKLIGEATA
jgi:sugar phosphate isomerase/epimerase